MCVRYNINNLIAQFETLTQLNPSLGTVTSSLQCGTRGRGV